MSLPQARPGRDEMRPAPAAPHPAAEHASFPSRTAVVRDAVLAAAGARRGAKLLETLEYLKLRNEPYRNDAGGLVFLSRDVPEWAALVRRLLFVSPHFAVAPGGTFSVAEVDPDVIFRAPVSPPMDLLNLRRPPEPALKEEEHLSNATMNGNAAPMNASSARAESELGVVRAKFESREITGGGKVYVGVKRKLPHEKFVFPEIRALPDEHALPVDDPATGRGECPKAAPFAAGQDAPKVKSNPPSLNHWTVSRHSPKAVGDGSKDALCDSPGTCTVVEDKSPLSPERVPKRLPVSRSATPQLNPTTLLNGTKTSPVTPSASATPEKVNSAQTDDLAVSREPSSDSVDAHAQQTGATTAVASISTAVAAPTSSSASQPDVGNTLAPNALSSPPRLRSSRLRVSSILNENADISGESPTQLESSRKGVAECVLSKGKDVDPLSSALAKEGVCAHQKTEQAAKSEVAAPKLGVPLRKALSSKPWAVAEPSAPPLAISRPKGKALTRSVAKLANLQSGDVVAALPSDTISPPSCIPAPPEPPALPDVGATSEGTGTTAGPPPSRTTASLDDSSMRRSSAPLKSASAPSKKRRKKGTPPPDTLSGPSHELTRKCPSCERMHNGLFGNGRFCGLRCSKTAGAKARWGPNSATRKADTQSKGSSGTGKASGRTSGRRGSKAPVGGSKAPVGGSKALVGGRGVAKRGRGSVAVAARRKCTSKQASERKSDEVEAQHAAAVAAVMTPGVPGNMGPSGAYGVGRGVSLSGSDPAYDYGDSSQREEAWAFSRGLPPKKKHRDKMLLCRVESEAKWPLKGLATALKVDCATRGLVGEFVGYFSDVNNSWVCGTVIDYRIEDDLHLIEHARVCENVPRTRWIDLRSADPRFPGPSETHGILSSLSTENV